MFQLLGIMAGPLYFTTIGGYTRFNVVGLVLMTLLLAWIILQFRKKMIRRELFGERNSFSVQQPIIEKDVETKPQHSTASQVRHSFVFILYILIMTTGIQIYSNNAILIVRNYYGLDNAVIKGGIMLTVLNAAGIATVSIYPWVSRRLGGLMAMRKNENRNTSVRGQAIYGLLFLGCVMLLKWPFNRSYTYLILLSLFTGGVYGLYWMKIRNHSMEIAANTHKKWVLTLFNYVDNIATLGASIILFATAILAQYWGVSYLGSITTALIICFAGSSLIAMCLKQRGRFSLVRYNKSASNMSKR